MNPAMLMLIIILTSHISYFDGVILSFPKTAVLSRLIAYLLLVINMFADQVFLRSSRSTTRAMPVRPRPSLCNARPSERTVPLSSRADPARLWTCLPPRLASTVTPRSILLVSTSSLERSSKNCALPPTTWRFLLSRPSSTTSSVYTSTTDFGQSCQSWR